MDYRVIVVGSKDKQYVLPVSLIIFTQIDKNSAGHYIMRFNFIEGLFVTCVCTEQEKLDICALLAKQPEA